MPRLGGTLKHMRPLHSSSSQCRRTAPRFSLSCVLKAASGVPSSLAGEGPITALESMPCSSTTQAWHELVVKHRQRQVEDRHIAWTEGPTHDSNTTVATLAAGWSHPTTSHI